jgi:hypothetical protein
MTWEHLKDQMVNEGYEVIVNFDNTYVEISCEKGGVKLSTRMPLETVEIGKYDVIEKVLRVQKSDLDAALLERGA